MGIKIHDPQESLYHLSRNMAKEFEEFKQDFSFLKENDIRRSVYAYCLNTAESVLFSLIFEKEQLRKKEWYGHVPYFQTPTPKEIKSTLENYDAFLRVAFVTEYFASFEIFFRIISHKIIPENRNTKFQKICEKLLDKLNLTNYQTRFDLYRILRNSLHNNGFIEDKHGYQILFDGRWYDLRKGNRIEVDWYMLCNLSADLFQCLNKIIKTEALKNIEFIEDPAYSPYDISGWDIILK